MVASEYIDLQVNGFAGVDFNRDDLTTADVARACAELRAGGVAGILATVITDTLPAMCRRLENLGRACEEDATVAETIWGIHVEGPFLNEQPGYIGAHPAAAARVSDTGAMQELLDAAGGLVRVVTLAPERDPEFQVTRMLAGQGIRVAAGHCNPSLEELRGAIDAGLSMFTHLGNGCPLEMHRHDNIIQRALSLSDRLWIGLIADGVHVPLPALGNYLKVAGVERAFVVTDAIAAAGRGPGTYELAGQQVVVDEHRATWTADRSHLVGSAATIQDVVEVLRSRLGLSKEKVERLTATNPREILGSDHER